MSTTLLPNTQKFIEAAEKRSNRKWQVSAAKSFDELVPQYDYNTIVSASRRLYANHGVVKGLIQQKASYSIGQAFLPQYLGTNKEWGKQAGEWLRKFYAMPTIQGYNFHDMLYLLSVSVDRDGDAFILLTSSQEGYPQLQLISSHQIGQRDSSNVVQSGRYKGFRIDKGIIFSKEGRPLAYRLLGRDESKDTDIPAANMIHIFEPEYLDQSRGLSLFSHAINAFSDMSESNARELTAQLLLASIAFIEHNPFGGPDDTNPTLLYESSDGRPTSEVYEDGTIKFFKSGDGSKLEAVNGNRPSAEYQEFHSRLERIAVVGTGWPKVLLDAAHGNGVADRVALRQGQRACEDRQSLLKPVCSRIVSYAISKAIKLGLLPSNEDFYRWSFSTPPFLSIDFGRDSNAIREHYRGGLINLTQICEEQGKTLEQHLRERAEEEAKAILIRQEIEQQYGVVIDPLKMRLDSPTEYNKIESITTQE